MLCEFIGSLNKGVWALPVGGVFKVAYVGGGSRFVVTLLHGLAHEAEALGSLGRPIEIDLLDVDVPRAAEMARYAAITARQTGLPITAFATGNRERALDGADWVIVSVGLWDALGALRRRFLEPMGNPYVETGPGVAVEGVAAWRFLAPLAEQMQRLAPGATLTILVNPTDVLAAALAKAYDVQSVGVCVEVPGLVGWLSYYLEVPPEELHIEHIGVNHVGWVSHWTAAGKPGGELFWARVPPRMSNDDWYPHTTFFVWIYQALGYMRSSPYHHWPFHARWDDGLEGRNRLWAKACLPAGLDQRQYRQAALERALQDGRMIPEPSATKVHPEATSYAYPDTRRTLGALAVGLAGGLAGPVPLQVRNGRSNPCLPEDAWVEVPCMVEGGRVAPQSVPEPPSWLFSQTVAIAEQRRLLADWLAGRDPDGLAKGLLAMPEAAPIQDLLRLARELPGALSS